MQMLPSPATLSIDCCSRKAQRNTTQHAQWQPAAKANHNVGKLQPTARHLADSTLNNKNYRQRVHHVAELHDLLPRALLTASGAVAYTSIRQTKA
jgi:hypothetical protein